MMQNLIHPMHPKAYGALDLVYMVYIRIYMYIIYTRSYAPYAFACISGWRVGWAIPSHTLHHWNRYNINNVSPNLKFDYKNKKAKGVHDMTALSDQ